MTILVFGDLILDEYWQGTTKRLSPEAPVPVITDIKKKQCAGGAANVALNIKSMGSPVILMSQCSKDFNLGLLNDITRKLLYCDTTPTKTRIITDNHVVCRMDDEEYQKVELTNDWVLPDTDICVLSDYNKGFLHDCRSIIQYCKTNGIKTIVDPKKDWNFYRGCWLLKANAKELSEQIGREYDIEELETICSTLSHTYDIQNLIITLGGKGMYVWDGRFGTFISAEPNNVVDVTGAGDVVLAALAHYTYNGKDLISAAEKANSLAAISVSKLGSYVVTEEDIKHVETKVVFTNGCFDVLHAGHLDYLRKSKKLGSKLIVGLNSDRSVKDLKGEDRPINNQNDRKKMLESLEFVDEVIIFDDPTPYDLISRLKPDIITKGGDYTVDQVVGNDLVNQVVIIPILEGYSTTKIIEKIGKKS